MIRVERLRGEALGAALDDVARLRIKVFRAFPYLYDGDAAYERDYLQTYRDSPDAVLVGAFDGRALVGASTGTPMEDHSEFAAAFAGTGVALQNIFYCAESVLLPEYRGQGIGHAFFDSREKHGRDLGRLHSAFCAVIRPRDHVLRPADYRPLDPFWRGRGYAPVAGAIATYRWKDIDQPEDSDHSLQFWMRDL